MLNKKLKIMVADDEMLMRGLLTSYLSKDCRHEIYKARDGKEALELYQLHGKHIDLLFLDIDMPKVDGMEVLKQVRVINPAAYVVIISGIGTLEVVTNAIKAGVNGFIAKPYTNCKIEESLNNYRKHAARIEAAVA